MRITLEEDILRLDEITPIKTSRQIATIFTRVIAMPATTFLAVRD